MTETRISDADVELRSASRELRSDIIRMIAKAGSGHPGGSLSAIDILAALYLKVLRHRPAEPLWPERDRLVLSKGHACPALYAVMARCGYFPRQQLDTLRVLGSPLQGHPDRLRLAGIEASTGSLGQGLSIALGMALAARMDRSERRVFCVLGDGEMQEGQVWEAAMAAPKFALENLTAVVDMNGGQIDGPTREVMDIEPLAEKFRAFRWEAREVDGHDFKALLPALQAPGSKGRPVAVLAKTVKGKGVSFMEGGIDWHGKAPTAEEAARALRELEGGKS
ncbi:MAG: transketolase [Elusimicrobiota bacterium]|jgi:transketolase